MIKLYLANKRYSSWSLRVWLLCEVFGIKYSEETIFLRHTDTHRKIDKVLPSAKLPILQDGSLKISESLAIIEYLAEKFPSKNIWPKNSKDRALARYYASEMHGGFMGLRMNCPMNCFAKPLKVIPDAAKPDIQRIRELWTSCLSKNKKGGFLFGAFSAVDAMYAPVVIRFHTYGIPVSKKERAYMDRVLGLAAMKKWISQASVETEQIAQYEINR